MSSNGLLGRLLRVPKDGVAKDGFVLWSSDGVATRQSEEVPGGRSSGPFLRLGDADDAYSRRSATPERAARYSRGRSPRGASGALGPSGAGVNKDRCITCSAGLKDRIEPPVPRELRGAPRELRGTRFGGICGSISDALRLGGLCSSMGAKEMCWQSN